MMKDLKHIVADIQKQAVPVPASLLSGPNGKSVSEVYRPPTLAPAATPAQSGGANPWKGQQPAAAQPQAVQPQGAGFTPAKSGQLDIITMQQKLVELCNELKSNVRLKAILELDAQDVAALGYIGNVKEPNKADGSWGKNTNQAVSDAIVLAKLKMLSVATERKIELPFDANTIAGANAALAAKSPKAISDLLDKMMLAVPELANAVSKPGRPVAANELSDAEKFRLAEISNEMVAEIVPPRGGSPIQVMFADIASPAAFQQFIAKNKIKRPGAVLKLINDQIQKQPGAKPAVARPQAL